MPCPVLRVSVFFHINISIIISVFQGYCGGYIKSTKVLGTDV